ncbi:endonuclease/exonuclease/phosphatase family protein [Rhodohalobacter mucosus]|nr:endonuclease/exonuclease/phosphatase family protein [Rhodohalobacter mucosus]
MRNFLLLLVLFIASCTGMQTATQSGDLSSNRWNSAQAPAWYNPSEFDTLTVVTWNLEHFVDGHDNPYINHPRENNPGEGLAERRRLLAQALSRLDADIVVFQEVESAPYVQEMAQTDFEELGYRLVTAFESNDWYMNVVIMSRVPLRLTYSYGNVYTFRREEEGETEYQNFTNNRMLSAEVAVNEDFHFLLTGVHLKAGRGEGNARWRMGQIEVLRDHYSMILDQYPDARILLAGDLNIIPGDPEFDLILGENTDVRFVDPFQGVNAFTIPADNPTRQLDHILPNDKMMRDYIPGSGRVAYPFSPDSMRAISDHLPVLMKFNTIR